VVVHASRSGCAAALWLCGATVVAAAPARSATFRVASPWSAWCLGAAVNKDSLAVGVAGRLRMLVQTLKWLQRSPTCGPHAAGLSDTLDRAVVLLCCHAFCRSCIDAWCRLKRVCPLCKVGLRAALSRTGGDGPQAAAGTTAPTCKDGLPA
jgi:hypothetical protein